jgi:L,D-peptidoglycan transpeptidase YkuD (ErfK/YbiS/YcfS/YnhG family)
MKSLLPFYCLLATIPPFVRANAQGAPASPLRQPTQLIVVVTPGWDAVDGRLQRYQRGSVDGPWKAVGDPVPIVVGKNGMAWGSGVALVGMTNKGADPVKKEGDGKSPAGIFSLGTAFGYAARKPSDWQLPYLALTPSTECVDDSNSRFYNRVVDRSTVSPDWNSSEHMRDVGEAYRWGIVVNHNTDSPRPGGGSCIFMHIWSGPGRGTAGCTAMPEEQIKSILAWLDPAAKPLLVQMPLAQYRQTEKLLHLPSPPSLPHP